MNEAIEALVSFIGNLIPLIILLSVFGFGSRAKKEKESAEKKAPTPRPRPRPVPEPEPATDDPFAGYDPFAEPRPAPAAPPAPPTPPPVRLPAPAPRPRAPKAAPVRVESTEAYAIDATVAYSLGDSVGQAYDLVGDDRASTAYATKLEAYGLERDGPRLQRADELVQRRKLGREDLRRAILMREILDQPVALRDETRRYW